MKEFVINLGGVNTYGEFYQAIIQGLQFPDWCGDNPDAIWDLLTGYMEYPAQISVIDSGSLPQELLGEFALIKETFSETEKWFEKLHTKVKFIYIK